MCWRNGGETPNPAGLIGALFVRFGDGRAIKIVTDVSGNVSRPARPSAGHGAGRVGHGSLGHDRQGHSPQTFPELYGSYESVAEVLARLGVPPDFESDATLRYIHRREGKTDIYFVANPADSRWRHSARSAWRENDPRFGTP